MKVGRGGKKAVLAYGPRGAAVCPALGPAVMDVTDKYKSPVVSNKDITNPPKVHTVIFPSKQTL